MGDGFSKHEATPTGVTRVTRRPKISPPSVSFGQLDLTQTVYAEPEPVPERRKGRFMRTRKRKRFEDDPFDSADVQLTPTLKKGPRKTTLEDCGIPASRPHRESIPAVRGLEGMEEGEHGNSSHVAETQTQEVVPGKSNLPRPSGAPASVPAAVNGTHPTLSCPEERVKNGLGSQTYKDVEYSPGSNQITHTRGETWRRTKVDGDSRDS